ncbi:MAG: acyltransferase [Vampirovibrionales bacterium]|nr:acyltransferase [Vampirovibrionales bacterium]
MSKIHTLTGIRGFAALWVVLYHLMRPLWAGDAVPVFFAHGYLGVDLFFLLSGFVIALVHERDFTSFQWGATLRFLWLRMARILPAHYVMLAVYVALYAVKGALRQSSYNGATCDATAVLYNALNIHAWGVLSRTSCNFPSWSISAEWFAYLLFPLFALAFVRVRGRVAAGVLMMAIFALLIALAVWTQADPTRWEVGWGLARVSGEFLIGCCIYRLFDIERRSPSRMPWNWACGAAFIALIALAGRVHGLALLPVMALFLLSLSRCGGVMRALFDNAVMRYLGETSYSLYMTHSLLILAAYWLAAKSAQWPAVVSYRYAILAGFVALSLMGAHALYALVERPSREWLRAQWDQGFPALRGRRLAAQ